MKISKYARKPFFVEAVQVNGLEMDEISEWCGGEIIMVEDVPCIKVKVKRPLHVRQTQAFAGDWILKSEHGFKVYTDRRFNLDFIEYEGKTEIIDTFVSKVEGLIKKYNIGQ